MVLKIVDKVIGCKNGGSTQDNGLMGTKKLIWYRWVNGFECQAKGADNFASGNIR